MRTRRHHWWAPRDSNPEDDTAFESSPSLPVPPEAHKAKAPRFLEGLGCLQELCLNQPHPSVPSKSLRPSDRYDLNRFFTKTRIAQFQIERNELSGNYPKLVASFSSIDVASCRELRHDDSHAESSLIDEISRSERPPAVFAR